MHPKIAQSLLVGMIVSQGYLALAASPTAKELKLRDGWAEEHFRPKTALLPISFNYGGRPSTHFISTWREDRLPDQRKPDSTQATLTYTDPDTGLVIRTEIIQFSNHPVVEWVVYLKNSGAQDTPILKDIGALDAVLLSPAGDPTLHYAKGAVCSTDDYQPLSQIMKAGARVRLEPCGGRSSSDFLPFFNLESSPRGGVVMGLGWSGEWMAEFTREAQQPTRSKAGMALTHLKLHPGEEIRTPRVALLFYEGNWIRGQNLWRHFILDHHRPQVDGKPLAPPIFNSSWGGTRAADHLASIQAIVTHDLPVQYYWIDAEWFGNGPWFHTAGDWQVKTNLFPAGFKPISDLLHQSGRRFLLWFEPERVCEGTPWAKELGQWLLEIPKERRYYNWGSAQSFPVWVTAESHRNQIKEGDRLFNLAIPEARQYLTDFISARITEFGLDCYRHDANIAPLEYWRVADAPDRQGITEIRWVEGLYAFWDELLRRHPHLIIDNCASGGRRIDLETLSRSTPFWRSDSASDPTAKQCHTYGISYWIPLNATGGVRLGRDTDYAFRSTISSSVVIDLFDAGDAAPESPVLAKFPFDKVKATLRQYQALQPSFLGDYYPLTSYSKDAEVWLAWQFDRPDLGEGFVQAFRRAQSVYESARFKLSGLDPQARYWVTNPDSSETWEVGGRELLEQGLLMSVSQAPRAALLTYRRVAGNEGRKASAETDK